MQLFLLLLKKLLFWCHDCRDRSCKPVTCDCRGQNYHAKPWDRSRSHSCSSQLKPQSRPSHSQWYGIWDKTLISSIILTWTGNTHCTLIEQNLLWSKFLQHLLHWAKYSYRGSAWSPHFWDCCPQETPNCTTHNSSTSISIAKLVQLRTILAPTMR